MPDLKYRQEKIKEKRKKTDFRDFVKEICSWYDLVLHRNKGLTSKYPETDRKENLMPFSDFDKIRDSLVETGMSYDFNRPLFDQYGELLKNINFPALANYAGNENCDFADGVLASKNVYLSFGIISDCENILYSLSVKNKALA